MHSSHAKWTMAPNYLWLHPGSAGTHPARGACIPAGRRGEMTRWIIRHFGNIFQRNANFFFSRQHSFRRASLRRWNICRNARSVDSPFPNHVIKQTPMNALAAIYNDHSLKFGKMQSIHATPAWAAYFLHSNIHTRWLMPHVGSRHAARVAGTDDTANHSPFW